MHYDWFVVLRFVICALYRSCVSKTENVLYFALFRTIWFHQVLIIVVSVVVVNVVLLFVLLL